MLVHPNRLLLTLVFILTLSGCSHHRVTTALEWCEQISGVDLMEKHAPFWAVFPGISFAGDSIRDDFVVMLNEPLMDKVGHRTDRMVWREGANLHLENLSTLMEIEPESVITGWQAGVRRANMNRETDDADRCLFGSVVSLFDSVHIHSGIWDGAGIRVVKDSVTTISTERRARLTNPI